MMFIGLIILVAVLLLATQSSRFRQVRSGAPTPGIGMGQPYPQQRVSQADLPTVIAAADSDITTFGDELRDLDLDVLGIELDSAAQQDYQKALDAYEAAKQSLTQVRTADQIRFVTEILEDGRYWIACVKARVANEPLPMKRPPCFFNPAHGPSARNVAYAPPGGTVREVPACAADAERVEAGADPNVRMVMAGPARVPYWEDPAYGAYTQGYYSNWQGDPVVRGLAIGAVTAVGLSMLPGLFGGFGPGMGDFGHDGFDGGGFDGDGFDFDF